MCRRIGIAWLAILLAGSAAPARADLSVTIGSTSIAPGGAGTIDVYLTSNATSNPDMINNYGFELQISGPHDLQFSNPPGTAFGSSPQYVFFGDSSGVNASVSSVNAAYDTFTAGDSTASGNPVSLSAADPPMLLAAIVLSAPTNSVHAGDVDTISLVPLSGTGSMAGGTPTFFDVVDFSNTGLETSAVPFTSTSGTVQITAAAPVPEPASRITTLTGAILLMAYGMGRRRRPRAHRPESP